MGALVTRAFERPRDAYSDLVAAGDLTPTTILFSLFAALVLGAFQALSPGHGKPVVAAYLVGSRGTAGHALFLGATVTATHTIGVYALGFVTLYLSAYILPEQLYPMLQIVSGLLVIGIGAWLFATRLRGALAGHRSAKLREREHAPAHGHGTRTATGTRSGIRTATGTTTTTTTLMTSTPMTTTMRGWSTATAARRTPTCRPARTAGRLPGAVYSRSGYPEGWCPARPRSSCS